MAFVSAHHWARQRPLCEYAKYAPTNEGRVLERRRELANELHDATDEQLFALRMEVLNGLKLTNTMEQLLHDELEARGL